MPRFGRLLRTSFLLVLVTFILSSFLIDWTVAHRHYVEIKQLLLRQFGYLQPVKPLKSWDPSQVKFDNKPGQEFVYNVSDIAIVLKTGWQTSDRLQPAIDILPEGSNALNTVLVSDHSEIKGKWVIHDVIAPLLHDPEFQELPRMLEYKKMHRAINAGDEKAAKSVSGWDLDALKNIPGLQLAYTLLPRKKWYYMVDDDTYTHYPSLLALIHNLDSSNPHYLGHAVGGQIKFAYGGTGILLSEGAMRKFYIDNPSTVRRYIRSTMVPHTANEYWPGDILLGFGLGAVGVFIDEPRDVAFWYEPPDQALFSAEKACAPIATYHHLKPSPMSQLHNVLGKDTTPKTWLSLWQTLTKGGTVPKGRDRWQVTSVYGGRYVDGINGWMECRTACSEDPSAQCLGWQWEKGYHKCFLGSYLVVGREVDGVYSGTNAAKINDLLRSCGR